MIKKWNAQNVKCEEYQKDGVVKGKQRYRCKECGYNYRTEKYYKYYSDEEKEETLRYYNEGLGRLLGMDLKSMINWVKRQHNSYKTLSIKLHQPKMLKFWS